MTTADALTVGPRGRRMLLAYAMEVARTQPSDSSGDSLGSSVFLASYHLECARGSAPGLFGPGAEEARRTVRTPEDVAHHLSELPLPDVTDESLRSALFEATDTAMYWQEPDGDDLLAGTEPVRYGLRRFAEHIARSPLSQWWTTATAPEQWSVSWNEHGPDSDGSTNAELLQAHHDSTVREEDRAARERPADPSVNCTGQWWSTPNVRSSTRRLFDGGPAGLWFVEDSLGWERAAVRRVNIPPGSRVYEVDDARAWAELCRRFPVEVTAQKQDDWYRTTGRQGRWVIPDWVRCSERYAGVHLTVSGYLAAAGTAIDVDAETASVIAGWAPDETYWLTDAVDFEAGSHRWVRHNSRSDPVWIEATPRG